MNESLLIHFCLYPSSIKRKKVKRQNIRIGSCLGSISALGVAEIVGPLNEIDQFNACLKHVFKESQRRKQIPQTGYVFLPQDLKSRLLVQKYLGSAVKGVFSSSNIQNTKYDTTFIEYTKPILP